VQRSGVEMATTDTNGSNITPNLGPCSYKLVIFCVIAAAAFSGLGAGLLSVVSTAEGWTRMQPVVGMFTHTFDGCVGSLLTLMGAKRLR